MPKKRIAQGGPCHGWRFTQPPGSRVDLPYVRDDSPDLTPSERVERITWARYELDPDVDQFLFTGECKR